MTDLSIIIVQKNDQINLHRTLSSIVAFSQVNKLTKVIVKSYGDADDYASSICDEFTESLDLRHIIRMDGSIYEAMNQAIAFVDTKYLMFLNAGDVFARPICDLTPALAQNPEILKYLVRVENNRVRLERASLVYFLRRMLNHQGLIYSLAVFGNGFDTSNVVTGDLRHIIEDDRYKRISYVDEILVEYLGGGFATQEQNVLRNWRERAQAYRWRKARLRVKLALSGFAILRLKLGKWL